MTWRLSLNQFQSDISPTFCDFLDYGSHFNFVDLWFPRHQNKRNRYYGSVIAWAFLFPVSRKSVSVSECIGEFHGSVKDIKHNRFHFVLICFLPSAFCKTVLNIGRDKARDNRGGFRKNALSISIFVFNSLGNWHLHELKAASTKLPNDVRKVTWLIENL